VAGTVSDFLVSQLKDWGVRRIYGYPGDGINGLLGAIQRQYDEPDPLCLIQVRHEEMAAFMACAHAKFTGDVGVCLATSGPGAIHLLNGLYDAKLDDQPVVAIVGQSARMSIGGDFQQEVDLQSLFKDVAHEYVQTAMDGPQVRTLIDRAIRTALTDRTPTCVILPRDVQELPFRAPPREHGTVVTGVGYSAPRVIPADHDLQQAADVLNAGERVAILAGAGAMQAADELTEVADILGAGVAKALLGKTVLPDDLPFVTGTVGLLGTRPSWDMLNGCDTLLMIGSSFPYAEFLPPEGRARGVQIDIDGTRLSMRYPMEVNLVGDSRETLRALIPLLRRKADRAWRQRIEGWVSDWWDLMSKRAALSAQPLNPRRVLWEMSPKLPDDCIITADSGCGTVWYAQDVRIRRGMMASLSGGLASMGCAVPYAIGAKFAFPHRVVVAIAGDGAMQMNGLNELITIEKYWRQWDDPRLIVLVLNNQDLNMVTWEMRALEGNPRFAASQDIPDFPYARFADSLGFKGIRVDHPDAVATAWQEALAADRPVVFEAIVDPNVPPLPPHLDFQQAKSYMSALLKGDANAKEIVRQSLKAISVTFLPATQESEQPQP
jgi:pyruvate dehydrogenase (quinone)